MIKHLAILMFAFVAVGCQVNMHSTSTQLPETATAASINPHFQPDYKYAAFTIKNMEQAGDFMVIDVSYSGGCADHEFEFVSNGKYEPTYPPELEVKLWHNSNNDRCRAVIDERLYFDLRPFQYPGTTQIRLMILNDDNSLSYNY